MVAVAGQTGARSETFPTQIANEKRREQAVELRLSGATFQQIAQQCGYTDKSSAWEAVRRAVRRIGREQAEELFDADMARLDKLLMAVWPKAMKGDLHAVDRVLSIMQRRARMLGYEGVTITTEQSSATADTSVPSLAELLGTDAGELEQRMARVLHESMPTVIDQDGGETDEQG